MMLDDMAWAAARALGIARYDPLRRDGRGAVDVMTLLDDHQDAPDFNTFIAHALWITADPATVLAPATGLAPLALVMGSAAHETEPTIDIDLTALDKACRRAWTIVQKNGLGNDQQEGRKTLEVLDHIAACGPFAFAIAAPAYRLLLASLARSAGLTAEREWTSEDFVRFATDRSTYNRASLYVRDLLTFIAEPAPTIGDTDAQRARVALRADIVGLLRDPAIHAVQRGEHLLDTPTEERLSSLFTSAYNALRIDKRLNIKEKTASEYGEALLKTLSFAATLNPGARRLPPRLHGSTGLPLDPDDLLPDDVDDQDETEDAAGQSIIPIGSRDQGHNRGDRHGRMDTTPTVYRRARAAQIAAAIPWRLSNVPLIEVARTLALIRDDFAGRAPDQTAVLGLFLLAFHTGLNLPRLTHGRRASILPTNANDLRPDGPVLYVTAEKPLLVYRSIMDGSPLPPEQRAAYRRTDGLRYIILPDDIADVMARIVPSLDRPDLLFGGAGDGQERGPGIATLLDGLVRRAGQTRRRSRAAHLASSFWDYHVAIGRMNATDAHFISDRRGHLVRVTASYSTRDPKALYDAHQEAVWAVTDHIREAGEKQELGDVTDYRAIGTPSPLEELQRGTDAIKVRSLPALGSPYLPREDTLEGLFEELRRLLGEGDAFQEAIHTAEGHNLATAYLILSLCTLEGIRPQEVDDLMIDLIHLAGPGSDAFIPCSCIVLEGKPNVNEVEDRLLRLGGPSVRLIQQALALPMRAELERGCAAPARNRLFYLSIDGQGVPAAAAVIQRIVRDQGAKYHAIAARIRLYDGRHATRSFLLEALSQLGQEGDRAIDATMGHYVDGGWQDPLASPWTLGDIARATEKGDQLAKRYGIRPLPPIDGPRGFEDPWARLCRDRNDLVAWATAVAQHIRTGAINLYLRDDQARAVAGAVIHDAGRLTIPYLTPRGLARVAARAVDACTVEPLSRRRAIDNLTQAFCDAAIVDAPSSGVALRPERRGDAVALSLLRTYPLWALMRLRRRIAENFPECLLGDDVGHLHLYKSHTHVYALSLLLLLEESVVPQGGLRAIAAPKASITLHHDSLTVCPSGISPATPPWPVRTGSRAHLLALGLVDRYGTVADGHVTVCFDSLLAGTSPTSLGAYMRRLSRWAEVPDISGDVLVEWARFAALQKTPALHLSAYGGSPAYASSRPSAASMLSAYTAAYGPVAAQTKTDVVLGRDTLQRPRKTADTIHSDTTPRRPSSTATSLAAPSPVLTDITDQLRRLRNGSIDLRVMERACLDVVSQALEMPRPKTFTRPFAVTRPGRFGDALAAISWTAAAARAIQTAPVNRDDRNALLLALWIATNRHCVQSPKKPLKASSIADYVGIARRFMRSLGDLDLKDIAQEDISDFLDQHQSSPSTYNKVCAAVVWLLALPGLECDNTDDVDIGTTRMRDIGRSECAVVLPPDLFTRFLGDIDNEAKRAPARRADLMVLKVAGILGHLGLRRGEVYRLTVADIDAEAGGYILVWRSKRGTTRRVPLDYFPHQWRVVIHDHLALRLAQIGDQRRDTAPFLVQATGRPFARAATISDPVVNWLRTYPGCETITFHDLRDSAANLLFVQQAHGRALDVRDIASILGHASPIATRWYLHFLDQTRPATTSISTPNAVGFAAVDATQLRLLTRVKQRTAQGWVAETSKRTTQVTRVRTGKTTGLKDPRGPSSRGVAVAVACGFLEEYLGLTS